MYSQVDSGNSAVGYGQQSSDIESNDTSNKSVEQITKVVSTALNLATSLAKTASSIGVDLTQIDVNKANSNYLYSLAQKANAEQTYIDLQSSWFKYLRDHKPDGSSVSLGENDYAVWSESLAFLAEKEGYELTKISAKIWMLFLRLPMNTTANVTVLSIRLILCSNLLKISKILTCLNG